MDVLLDIAEPGESRLPHEEQAGDLKRVVGIDLGTTYSLVASVTQEGTPLCIPDDQGRASLPSVVSYGAGEEILVGDAATERAPSHPADTIASAKRFMGRGVEDMAKEGERTAYALETGEGGMVRIVTGQGAKSPVEVSAEILKSLKRRAEGALGGALFGAVVTVPAYFDDAQRQATKDAGRLAGLDILRLVNEPTAAALAYGLEEGGEGTVAIYDLGGGTFDISILKLSQGVFQVMATGGNSALGGDDFDHALARIFLDEIGVETPSPALIQSANRAARTAKESLTENDSASVEVTLDDGSSFRRTVTLSEFEAAIASLVKATGLPCRRAMKDAKVRPEDLNAVVLVGGSTRVPAVRAFVEALFKQKPLADLDPDQVVALGAAHQADLLSGNRRSDMLLLDVTPLSLGLETMGSLVEKIVPRNSPIPTAMAQEFTTFKDGQTAMAIHVLQGEREMVEQCRSLARFTLRGIPPLVAGAARIRVAFQVDADGLLTVTATEQTTGIEQSVEVKPSYGLSDQEVETMLRDALEHGEEDIRARMLSEARVEADRVLDALEAALSQDGALLDEAETEQVRAAMDHVRTTRSETDPQTINRSVEALDKATQVFAQRRMDAGIKKAMAGHKIEEFE
ncbi:MAG: Fe-S protein assembly chaperone HscA [Magnetococcales bacterium]|nr:Fe-S protein assembly chaperone HscA [Magnetococcales bacterium]